jgi:hypothetical protein
MRTAIILTLLVVAASAQDAASLAEQTAAADKARQQERAQAMKERARALSESRAERERARDEAAKAKVKMTRDHSDQSYRAGTRAIDKHSYDDAIVAFDRVIEEKGSRGEGALYWKAYAQNKAGRRDQALATLGQMQKEFPQGRWASDAKALEVEVRQAAGRPVAPDAEADDELKLLAINGLMASDASRALPLLEKVIADPKASPGVKERALFVLAQGGDAKNREVLLRIAKGGGNPDMQMRAVEFLGVFSKGNTQTLAEVYGGTADPGVKRAVLRGLMMAGDYDRLLGLAKTEQSPELRVEAIHMLGVMKRGNSSEALLSLYSPSQDRAVKKAIADGLFIQRNAKGLIELARKETDASLKKGIVERLSTMNTKEAQDYMLELLNK